ncbi:hypothetical protein ACLOJK_020399 [Asimina triloba]
MISRGKHPQPSKSHISFYCLKLLSRCSCLSLLSTQASVLEVDEAPSCQVTSRISSAGRTEAQAALLDYLHCTRGLNFIDAEHMSMNSPVFLARLAKHVGNEKEIRWELTRFLRYHPINEFEVFLESVGLKPMEVCSLLPTDSIHLSNALLRTVHVLWNYGIPRGKLGKIYKEAAEIFKYNSGVLESKIQAYKDMGLSTASIVKLIVSCPTLFVGSVSEEFVQVSQKLKSLSIDCNWLLDLLLEKSSYDWGRMLGVLHFLTQMGYSKEELGGILLKNPGFLLDGSGAKTYSLIGLLLKLGLSTKEIIQFFANFPLIQIGGFVRNLQQSLIFLFEIEMETEEIGKIVHGHLELLGLCSLKKPNSLFAKLNVGKQRLCGIIKQNPEQLKNWVLGSKISHLPKPHISPLMQKKNFFLKLGFVENSDEMKRALKVCCGKSIELQERFDCLVEAGLKWNDVCRMIKVSPQILNQSRDLIEKKIDVLVNYVGYPLESLVAFPLYMSYTIQRVRTRYLMYNWLQNEGKASPALALSSILAYSDEKFILRFVKRHPKGLDVWENFKKELFSG